MYKKLSAIIILRGNFRGNPIKSGIRQGYLLSGNIQKETYKWGYFPTQS